MYDADDIFQEAFIYGMEALNGYDGERGTALKTFLYKHIVNRLINLKSYAGFQGINGLSDKKIELIKSKRKINNAIEIDSHPAYFHDFDIVDNNELMDYIDERLDYYYRVDYKKILAGLYVEKSRREFIFDKVKELFDCACGENDGE